MSSKRNNSAQHGPPADEPICSMQSQGERLRVQIEPIIRQVRPCMKDAFSEEADKAFIDEMWGEEP